MVNFHTIAILSAIAAVSNASACHQLNCYFNTCARSTGEALGNAGEAYSQITNYDDGYGLDRFQTAGGSACKFSVTSVLGPQPEKTIVSEVTASKYDGWINVWRVPKALQPSGCTIRKRDVQCHH
jgi:hypothetical protein